MSSAGSPSPGCSSSTIPERGARSTHLSSTRPGTCGTLGGLLLDVPSSTMAAFWDRLILDWSRFGLGNHIWSGSVTFDPEGTLSTIPAICTAMLGVLAGRWIGTERPLEERLNALFAAGCLGMMFGLIWDWGFPI